MAMEARLSLATEPAGGDDPAAPAGDPAPAALDPGAPGSRPERAARESAARRSGAETEAARGVRLDDARRARHHIAGARTGRAAADQRATDRRSALRPQRGDVRRSRERSLVVQEEREDLPFENIVRSVNLADRPPRRAAAVHHRGPAGAADRRRDHRQPRRGRLSRVPRWPRSPSGARPRWKRSRRSWPWCRAFDPPGVAARSIQGACSSSSSADPNPRPGVGRDRGGALRRPQPAPLSRHRAGAQAAPLDRIMESIEEIMGLEPKPGRSFGATDSRYIVPDVVVHKMGDEYVVVLNEDGVPRLRVNSALSRLTATDGRQRSAGIRGAEAPFGGVADQERGPASADAAQGDRSRS